MSNLGTSKSTIEVKEETAAKKARHQIEMNVKHQAILDLAFDRINKMGLGSAVKKRLKKQAGTIKAQEVGLIRNQAIIMLKDEVEKELVKKFGKIPDLPAVVSHSGAKQGEAANVQSASKSTSLHDASVPAKQKETPVVQIAESRQPNINQELERIRKENVDLKARLQAASEHAEVLKAQLAEARKPKVNQELEGIRKENFDLKARLQAAAEHAKQDEVLKAHLVEAVEEVKKLKDQVQPYENSLDVLVEKLRVIEAAYAEREAN